MSFQVTMTVDLRFERDSFLTPEGGQLLARRACEVMADDPELQGIGLVDVFHTVENVMNVGEGIDL